MDSGGDGGEDARISAWLDVLGVTRDALGESLCDPVRAAEVTAEQLAGLSMEARAAVEQWAACYWDAINVVHNPSATTTEDLHKVRRVARHLRGEDIDQSLYNASGHGNVLAFAVLVEAGGDPINHLSSEDTMAVIDVLGAEKADACDEYEETLLTRACEADSGTTEIVRKLLSMGVRVNGAWARNPLTLACRGFRVNNEVVQLLLDAGADVHAGMSSGDTPLRGACDFGHTDTATLLLLHGARMTAEIREAWDAGDSVFPELELHFAACEGAERQRGVCVRRCMRMAPDRRAALWGALAGDTWGEHCWPSA